MKSKDFLRSKGILSNDADHFIIDFHDGREINLAGLLEEYAQQSQPSGMRWVREKPANDREFVLVTASLINGEWHYHGWEIIEVPDGYFALCELHGEEWGPYEDLSAEYYLVLSPVSESSPGVEDGSGWVKELNERQKSGMVHPYTCDRKHKDCEVNCQPRDYSKDGVLIATEYGWICPCGRYAQPLPTPPGVEDNQTKKQ